MFTRILGILLAAGLTTSVAQAAEIPFVGSWKLDPARTRLPDEMKVQSKGGHTYAFDFGGGAETIVVDGTDQPGQDRTRLSVKAQAPDTWIVQRKKDGRLLLRARWKLSKDGRSLSDYFRGVNSDGTPLSMDYVYRRTGEGSGFAGDWRSIKETMNSPYLMQVKAFRHDGLSFVFLASHVTRNVKFDGRDYADAGPSAARGGSSSVRRIDARALVITGKYAGKVTVTEDFQLSTDLKTLTMTQHVAGRDKPNVFVFDRT
ncbi:MAG TPA: hypothetical protein VHV27_00955 [Phenylobacterium sp.]|nr:hypothetical protein [Phenylobacterium sp.]